MNNGLVILGIGAAVALMINKNKAKSAKKKKSKKGNYSKKIRPSEYNCSYTECALPDYDFEDGSDLNEFEKLFKKRLKKVKKKMPKGHQLITKYREPRLQKNGFTELAYIVSYPEDVTFAVFGEVYNAETLSHANHELCHLEDGHTNPDKKGFYQSDYKKELEVEDCNRESFEEDFGLKWRYGRSKRDIGRAYKN